MIVKGQIDVENALNRRTAEQVEEKQADWEDEAARAAIDGNPRRSHYLHIMATRLPRLVEDAYKRGLETRRVRRYFGEADATKNDIEQQIRCDNV